MGNTRGRAVVAGAAGFIGQRLVRELREHGYDVVGIGRNGPDARWDDASAVQAVIDGSELVVNLAGKSVNCRYTDRNRDEILSSRIDTTRALRQAIARSTNPPRVWLNASTATIYRYSLDRPMTEADGEVGTGFSADIAQAWEAEFFTGDLAGTRRVALRMAIVLGDGPATATLVRLARVGLGGPHIDGWWFPHRRYRGIGTKPTGTGTHTHHSHGRQKFSWIHIDDVVDTVKFIVDNDALDGLVNLSAPQISDNRTLMSTLRRRVGAVVGLPAFKWMLEPAMWILRTEPELVLKSRWVTPERLLEAGYVFTWPDLGPAITDVVKR